MALALASVLALLAAAACSDDDGGGGDASATTAAAGESTTSSGDGDDPAPSEPQPGGVLRLGIARLTALDPAEVSPQSPSTSIAADLLWDGLTELDRDGTAAPGLASGWTTPDGAVTWRFTLRPDARFADGSPVEAADVEHSLERVAARGPSSFAAAALEVVADVRVVDPATVEVALRRPLASLPELLSAPAYGVIDAAVSASPASNGSGPFRFAAVGGDVVQLVRVTDGAALLDGVELHQFDDLGSAVDAFLAGSLDWTLVPPHRAQDAAEAAGDDGFVAFHSELLFAFNLADPAFADVRFRRAVVSAVDREAVVRAVLFGVADPLDVVVPDGVAGHDAARCGAGCTHDADAARALLAEAFPPGGPPVPTVVLDHEDTAQETALARAVAQQLDAVGIPVSLRAHPSAEFAAFATSGAQALVRSGWVGAWPGADAYLDPLFRSGSPDNPTGFADPFVDALLDEAGRTLDPAERLRLLGEAEAVVLAAAVVLPVAQFRLLSAASERVEDLEIRVDGTFPAEQVWLSS